MEDKVFQKRYVGVADEYVNEVFGQSEVASQKKFKRSWMIKKSWADNFFNNCLTDLVELLGSGCEGIWRRNRLWNNQSFEYFRSASCSRHRSTTTLHVALRSKWFSSCDSRFWTLSLGSRTFSRQNHFRRDTWALSTSTKRLLPAEQKKFQLSF